MPQKRGSVSLLPVTSEDILEEAERYMEKTGASAEDAIANAERSALAKILTPNILKNKTREGNLVSSDVQYQDTTPGTRFVPGSRTARAITGGLGTAASMGATGLATGGPFVGIAAGLAGLPIGALSSLAGDEYDKSSGLDPRAKPVVSADRILDLTPGVNSVFGKLKSASPTLRAALSGLFNAGSEYAAGKVNRDVLKTQDESPEIRALTGGVLSLPDVAMSRAAGKIRGSQKLNKEMSNLTSLPVQQEKRDTDVFSITRPVNPVGAMEDFQYSAQNALNNKAVLPGGDKKIIEEIISKNPRQAYRFILSPIIDVKNQKELLQNTPEFVKRLKLIGVMGGEGGDKAASFAKGLREEFMASLMEKSPGNTYGGFPNPDSLRARLEAIGPEVTNLIFNSKEAYKTLISLSKQGSQVGPLGRQAFKTDKGGLQEMIQGKLGFPNLDQDRSKPFQLTDALPTLVGGAVTAVMNPGSLAPAVAGGAASLGMAGSRAAQKKLIEDPLKNFPAEALEMMASGKMQGVTKDMAQWAQERLRERRKKEKEGEQ